MAFLSRGLFKFEWSVIAKIRVVSKKKMETLMIIHEFKIFAWGNRSTGYTEVFVFVQVLAEHNKTRFES